MKIQTLGWLIGFTALASSASILACSQAEVVCQAGHAGSTLAFAAKYFPVGTPGAACVLPGDEVGFETYHPKGGGDDGTQPDFAVPSLVALQTGTMGQKIIDKKAAGSVDPDGVIGVKDDGMGGMTHFIEKHPKHPAYALGSFATVSPEADGFCVMAAPAPAVQNFPLIPAVPPDPMAVPPDPGSPEVPAEAVKYEWTNVKVYVTASAQGTQFSGHLKYTDNACAAEYDVAGVWPSAACGKDVDDGKGGMKTVPDNTACCPNPDPIGGRAAGSGINPDFPVKCDPDLLLCVLDIKGPSELPALNPTWALDKDGVATGICALTPAATAK